MWLPTPPVDSLTRPRLAVALVSAAAAATVGYYVYQSQLAAAQTELSHTGLHRRNAIRRSRRPRRLDTASSSSSEVAGDATTDAHHTSHDAVTVVEDSVTGQWWDDPNVFPPSQRAGQNIVNLLFRVSEDNARRNGCVHRGCQCNACGMVPIRGIRYRCANCADFDLCEGCEAQGVHIKTHVFYKIKIPAPPFSPRQMQPVWYPGDPDTCPRSLPKELIEKLTYLTGFERPELEAFWEQWTFMANTEWREDPDDMCVAMDRKTFERCLVPTGGSRHAAPNLIHDRMFNFYDSNGDELIGFTEFLEGLSYRKRKDKLRKVFEGYDMDGDGYVDRRDFLRMFRGYYVLYKQMHKDILDGLEAQLLASTEAQQLVSGRQPLSSLFGREDRIPPGDGGVRIEGKIYHRDGSVDIDDGYHSAIRRDTTDTASRGDILTSLFACETDHRSPRQFFIGGDPDNQWQNSQSLSSGADSSRAYLIALLDPPNSTADLPDILRSDRDLQLEHFGDEEADGECDSAGGLLINNATGTENGGEALRSGAQMTDSERRAMAISHSRRLVPQLEKRRRDMARRQLHDRWRRRQFYLDEEEGGTAPEDFEDDQDILVNLNDIAEASKIAGDAFLRTRSRSSSKVRFADDTEDFEIQSNPSTSSRSIPERWGGMEIPSAERDAGKEVLYQVTQQAFNELLDTIFKPAEDVAVEAAATKQEREEYKKVLDLISLPEDGIGARSTEAHSNEGDGRIGQDKTLVELLAESGYSITAAEPRNAVEIEARHDRVQNGTNTVVERQPASPEAEYRDPTLPQFRPNGHVLAEEILASGVRHPVTEEPLPMHDNDTTEQTTKGSTGPPSLETLHKWRRLEMEEAKAADRGGWGRLNFEEFESIYKTQESLGNRLDYLGSWIDFCIP